MVCTACEAAAARPRISVSKTDLKGYRVLRREVAQLREQLGVLEAAKYAPAGTRLSLTPKGPGGNGTDTADLMHRQERLRALYESKLAAALERCAEIETAIGHLPEPVERVILRERYLAGRSWRAICEVFRSYGYSERQVYRLHGSALLHLKDT